MENKMDKIELKKNDQEIVIKVNDEIVINLNENYNKIDTNLIFDKLKLESHYSFELDIGDAPSEKKLESLFNYTKDFLEKIKKSISEINYDEE